MCLRAPGFDKTTRNFPGIPVSSPFSCPFCCGFDHGFDSVEKMKISCTCLVPGHERHTTTRYEVYERWGKPPPLPLLPPSASSASPMSSSAFFLSFSCVSLSLSSSPVAPLSFLFAKCFHIHISLLERLEDFPRRGGLPDKLQHARVAAEGEVQVAVAVVLADREPRRGEG